MALFVVLSEEIDALSNVVFEVVCSLLLAVGILLQIDLIFLFLADQVANLRQLL